MNNNFIQKLFIVAIISVFCINVFAGPRSKRGLSAAPELLIPVGSIGTSLSGSNLSSVTGVEAIFWNPSGLAIINSKTGEAMFSFQKYIADINISYFAGAYKFGSLGNIGVSVKSLGFGDIEVTTEDAPEGTGETFSPTYLTLGLSFARAMTDRILFGTNVKLITERITNESAVGVAFDFGLQYIVGESGLRFGIALKNLGPSMKFDGPDLEGFYQPQGSQQGTKNEPRKVTLGDFELPTSLSLGVSYYLGIGKNNGATFNALYQNHSFNPDDLALGIEYNFKKLFYLRGGYNFDQDFFESKEARDDRLFGPTFGAGVRYNFGTVNVSFDYAYKYVSKSALSQNHYFTLNLGF